MNKDPNQQLEDAITRELQKLPQLRAPGTLVSRVLTALPNQSVSPWYRRPWQYWPAGLQFALLALLLCFFGALCLGGIKFTQAEGVTAVAQQFTGWLTTLGAIWTTLSVLAGAGILFLKQLHPLFLTSAVVIAFLSYAICLGLGTALYRHVFVSHQENSL